METSILLLILFYVFFRVTTMALTYIFVNSREPSKSPTIIPRMLSLFEILVWLPQELNYTVRLIKVPIQMVIFRYMRWTHRKIKDEDVVEFVLNSSFVIFLTHSHKSVWRLVLTDFALPSRRNFFKQALHLEFDLTERHVHFFSLNGHEVQCRQRILALLLYVLAFAIHPKVHAFQNTLQKGFQELPLKYWRMMAIGTYLNESAAFLPCLPFTGQGGFGLDWCREVLDYNATSGIPVHGIFDKKLLDASSFLRFAIHARNIIFQELDRAGLHMIDKESYFVCSVIHSLDHVSGGRALSWVWFDCRDGDANMRNFNILARNFFAPVSYWFLPDNRLESHWRDNEFYARLYHRFRKVNPELTSDVTLSMSS